jgi:hypothetical protein
MSWRLQLKKGHIDLFFGSEKTNRIKKTAMSIGMSFVTTGGNACSQFGT